MQRLAGVALPTKTSDFKRGAEVGAAQRHITGLGKPLRTCLDALQRSQKRIERATAALQFRAPAWRRADQHVAEGRNFRRLEGDQGWRPSGPQGAFCSP